MNLAPKWAKAAALLGLRVQLYSVKVDALLRNGPGATIDSILRDISDFERKIDAIEAMKD